MKKNWTIEELQAMTGNTIEMTENNMKLLENSMKQLQEFQKTLGRTDIQETMKAYEKVSEQTEQEQEQKQDNKNKYTYDEISKEIDRIIDTATKENPLLKHILNHSYDIAKAYTLINFDNEPESVKLDCIKMLEIQCFRHFIIYVFPHPFGANSIIKVFDKKAVFISFSALFCNLNFTDSGMKLKRNTNLTE